MAETLSAAVDQPGADDLINFLKGIPDGRNHRGVRYPQWFLLLVTVLGILSGSRSSRDLEAFAKRHREALNEALGLNFKRWPSDATFLYLFYKAHLQEFGQVLQAWMMSQIPCGSEGLDQLVCQGIEKRPEMEGKGIGFRVAMRPGKRRALPDTPEGRVDDLIETAKPQASACSKLTSARKLSEHPFRVMKRQFGFQKTRLRGMVKNRCKVNVVAALANLFMVRHQLLCRS